VPRYGRQTVATLMVVLGLAMLDLGPRASAAFLPVVSLSPQIDAADVGTASSGTPDGDRNDQVWPPRSNEVRLVHAALAGHDAPSSGGAGSSSSSSFGSGHSSALLAGSFEVSSPALVAHLRTAAFSVSPQLLISSIFEPPRVGV
jgi:hypothetical protein